MTKPCLRTRTHRLIAVAVMQSLPALALGQACTTGFQPGGPGGTGIVDPFSAYVGPMADFQSKLYVSGAFSGAGTLNTNVVACFDPATNRWGALGGGVNLGNTNGFGAALATFTIGGTPRLVLGGSFANVINTGTGGGGAVADTTALAAWNGSAWSSLATGFQPATGRSVWTLLDWEQQPGVHRLVAGGGFAGIGAATAYGLAYFDGEGWNNFAGPSDTGVGGSFSPVAFASTVYNGQLYIGGRFASVNGVAAALVARWSGSVWQRPGALAAGGSISDVSVLHVYNDGTGAKLYAGGYDMRVGGQPTSVAAFDGIVWRAVGQNLGGRTTCLAAFNDGSGIKLYAGWTADAQQHYIYRLENNVWTTVDGGVSVSLTGNFPSVFGLHVSGNRLYVGGNFQIAGGEAAYGIAQYGPCAAPPCTADFNHNGVLEPQDIFDFLNAWFALDPRADFNHIGGFSAQDIFDFLSAWFAGC